MDNIDLLFLLIVAATLIAIAARFLWEKYRKHDTSPSVDSEAIQNARYTYRQALVFYQRIWIVLCLIIGFAWFRVFTRIASSIIDDYPNANLVATSDQLNFLLPSFFGAFGIGALLLHFLNVFFVVRSDAFAEDERVASIATKFSDKTEDILARNLPPGFAEISCFVLFVIPSLFMSCCACDYYIVFNPNEIIFDGFYVSENRYEYDDIERIRLVKNAEHGYLVIEFNDGNRFKTKGDHLSFVDSEGVQRLLQLLTDKSNVPIEIDD